MSTVLDALKTVLTKLTEPVVKFVDKITLMITNLDKGTQSLGNLYTVNEKVLPSIKSLASQFEMFLPVIAAATAGFATFAGRGLLQNLPIIGNVLSKLKVFPVVMVVLALTSNQVRAALGNLLNAFAPLLPVIVQLGKVMANASTVFVSLSVLML